MSDPFEEVPAVKAGQLATLYHWIARDGRVLSITKIRESMERYIHFACVPSRDTIDRFVNKQRDIAPHFVVALTYFAGSKLKEDPSFFADVPANYRDILNYCGSRYETWTMQRVFQQNFLPQYKKRPFAVPKELTTLHSAIDELRMPAEALAAALTSIFGASAAEKLFGELIDASNPPTTLSHKFLAYRYSVNPGFVDKSAITITAERSKGRYARFENMFVDDKKNRRLTSGFATATTRKLYLIGSIDDFDGMKVMGFSAFSHNKDVIPGMLMSTSSAETIVCARLLLKRVDEIDVTSLGYKAEEEIRHEIGDHMPLIANRVEFKLNRKILFKNKVCSQRDMVVEVSKILRDRNAPRFTYEDTGAEFNPASTEDYTYNASLEETH
jgi:hypothetical protein